MTVNVKPARAAFGSFPDEVADLVQALGAAIELETGDEFDRVVVVVRRRFCFTLTVIFPNKS